MIASLTVLRHIYYGIDGLVFTVYVCERHGALAELFSLIGLDTEADFIIGGGEVAHPCVRRVCFETTVFYRIVYAVDETGTSPCGRKLYDGLGVNIDDRIWHNFLLFIITASQIAAVILNFFILLYLW